MKHVRTTNYPLMALLLATLVNYIECKPAAFSSSTSSSSSSASITNNNAQLIPKLNDSETISTNVPKQLQILHNEDEETAARFFISSDDIVKMIVDQTEDLPPHLKGPLHFFLGFTQQTMKNMASNMRSIGQMLITSLVMTAVKRIFFADLPNQEDRNKAGEMTDAILRIVNLFGH